MEVIMDPLGKQISIIYRLYQNYIRNELLKYKLGSGTYPLILCINKYPGMSQNELARYVKLDKAMVARNVKKLCDLKYMTKKCSTEEFKKQRLFLTQTGIEVIPDIYRVINGWEDLVLEGLDKETVLKTIGRIKLLSESIDSN